MYSFSHLGTLVSASLQACMTTTEYSFHPISEIFPLMGAKEFAELREDIRVNGQRDPITLLDEKILDGRNRYQACRELGVDPIIVTFNGVGTPLAFVISHNLRRRHLSEGQRAMVAAKLATIDRRGRPGKNTAPAAFISQGVAADMLNVSVDSVQRATKVVRHGIPDLADRIESDRNFSLTEAARIATQPKARQARILKKTNENKVVHLASHLKLEKNLRKAKTTLDVCMLCNPALPATEENFVVFLTASIAALKRRPGGAHSARYLEAALEEINGLNIADDTLPISDQILAAIREGIETEAEILRFTHIGKDDFGFAIANLEEHGIVEQVPQGGKTSVARGRRKMLWKICDKKGHRPQPAEAEDDDDDEAEYKTLTYEPDGLVEIAA